MEAMLEKRKLIQEKGPEELEDAHLSSFRCPACGDVMVTNESKQFILHDKPMCPEWAQYTENWEGYGNE